MTTVKQIVKDDKRLILYHTGDTYEIRYIANDISTNLAINITDKKYALSLFKKYKKELNL